MAFSLDVSIAIRGIYKVEVSYVLMMVVCHPFLELVGTL
jgi:hypothetical protein